MQGRVAFAAPHVYLTKPDESFNLRPHESFRIPVGFDGGDLGRSGSEHCTRDP